MSILSRISSMQFSSNLPITAIEAEPIIITDSNTPLVKMTLKKITDSHTNHGAGLLKSHTEPEKVEDNTHTHNLKNTNNINNTKMEKKMRKNIKTSESKGVGKSVNDNEMAQYMEQITSVLDDVTGENDNKLTSNSEKSKNAKKTGKQEVNVEKLKHLKKMIDTLLVNGNHDDVKIDQPDNVEQLEHNLTEKIIQIDKADKLNQIPINRTFVERKRDKKNGFGNEQYLRTYNEIVKDHDIQVKITQTFVRTFLKEIINDIKLNDKEKIPKSINIDTIVKNIVDSLPKMIDQDEFYMYMAEYLVAKSSHHYYYDLMASRIAVKRLHNTTSPNFLMTAHLLQENLDKNNDRSPILADDVFDIIARHHQRLQDALKYERDYMFDYFGIKTLERSYLYKLHFTKFKIIERPQHMIMRVALGIHGEDIDSAIETYDLISQKFFTHATPTLFNAGTRRAQMSSCFLQAIDDNIESIFDAVKDIGFTSKWSGGIGVHLSALRCRGSLIRGTNGLASGIIPLCVLLNKLAKYINQGGKRNGSIACYLEPHHADIFDFCDLRKNTGNDDNRARDLYLALWVSSLFMKRVKEDGVWSLMCPDECPGLNQVHSEEYVKLYERYEEENRYVKQVKARDLWRHILESQSETGFPYIVYKDNANAKSNQKNLGTIRSSNLCAEIIQYSDEHETAVCFTADTEIITKHGIKKIIDCDNTDILSYFDNDYNLNHNEHFETAKLIHNGEKQIYELSTQGNKPIKITHNHPVLVESLAGQIYQWKKVSELTLGDMIYTPNINPIIGFDLNIADNLNSEWLTGGWMTIRGWGVSFDPTENYPQNIKFPQLDEWKIDCSDNQHFSDKLGFKNAKDPMNVIPDTVKSASSVQIANFMSGLFSADGSVVYSNGTLSINLSSANNTLLYDIQSLLIPFGIRSRVDLGMLSIHGDENLERYMKSIGFKLCPDKEQKYMDLMETYSVDKKDENCSKVISIKKLGIESVYDLALPVSHNFFANGHVVHNCNLASICLPMYIDTNVKNAKSFNHEKLIKVCRVVVRNLDKIIDRNYYPTEKTKRSNMRHRPMGIGVQGLADVYNVMGFSYASKEAADLNKRIFETIYYACVDESKELAKRFGPYSTFKGSPSSQGQLQFHMWGKSEDDLLMGYDWKKLIEEVKKYGIRNSLLTALMPTASTSQIMGNSECIEPYMSNIFKRSTLAGEFIVVNKNLMKDLMALDLWDDDMRKRLIIENGSVKNLEMIPQHIRHVYETAFEIPQMHLVAQSADRGEMVDQAQSFNLFLAEPDFDILTSALFDGHDRGNKTGMYYYRSLPAINPINFGIDVEDIKRLTGRDATVDMISGSYNINNSHDKEDKQLTKGKSKSSPDTKVVAKNKAKDVDDKKTNAPYCKWKPGVKLDDCDSCGA
jgi:ribonucleoside-diphosphate reductase alpha chain